MTWRRVPPVSSPIAPASLIAAGAAAIAAIPAKRGEVAAALSATFAAPEVILTDSGTAALILALQATVSPGSVVAMPGYACIDIIAAAIGAQVRVWLYDVEPATLSPRLESVRHALRQGAKALVVAPLYGYPVNMAPLLATAAERGVPVIEDAAQAAGATLGGSRVGSFGDISILSFGRGKGLTGGSGGALLLREAEFLAKANEIRSQLRPATRGFREAATLGAQWMLGRPALYAIPSSIPALGLGEMIYKPPRVPAGLSAAASRVVRIALKQNDSEVRLRQTRAARLCAAAEAGSRFLPIQPVPDARPGYLRFAVLDSSASAIPNPHLGAVRGYPVALDEHVETRRILVSEPRALGGARELRDRLFTLPTHSMLADSDVARLQEWLGGT